MMFGGGEGDFRPFYLCTLYAPVNFNIIPFLYWYSAKNVSILQRIEIISHLKKLQYHSSNYHKEKNTFFEAQKNPRKM